MSAKPDVSETDLIIELGAIEVVYVSGEKGLPSRSRLPVPSVRSKRWTTTHVGFGKNHRIPDWLESPDGPFDQWAGGLGFEYFYGFLGGDTRQLASGAVRKHKARSASRWSRDAGRGHCRGQSDEEGLVGGDHVLSADPIDCAIGHVADQDIVRIPSCLL